MEPRLLLRCATFVTLILLSVGGISLLGGSVRPVINFTGGSMKRALRPGTSLYMSTAILMSLRAGKNGGLCSKLFDCPTAAQSQKKSLLQRADDMFAVRDDKVSSKLSRRTLLNDLRDISPPGMWPVGDDQDSENFQRRRPLLHDLRNIFPPGIRPVDDASQFESNEYDRRGLADPSR